MRRSVVVAIGALSVVALAGCGSGGGAGTVASGTKSSVVDPTALVAASYSKMTAAKSARFDLSMQLSADGQGGGQFSLAGNGSQNFAAKTAQLSLSLPENAGAVETRIVDRTVYERLPGSALPALKGKWIKIDIDKVSQQAGVGSTGDLGTTDPSQTLQLLTSVSNGVTKVGDERIRGVDTTHYRAVVDLGKVSAKAGNTPAQIARLEQMLGTSSYPVDVWIDDSGLPHRLQFQQPLPKQLTQGSGLTNAKLVATEEFYDFGAPVDVQAPPADMTVDSSQVTGGSSGSRPTRA